MLEQRQLVKQTLFLAIIEKTKNQDNVIVHVGSEQPQSKPLGKGCLRI